MKCRRIVIDEEGNRHIVWFGSYGCTPIEESTSTRKTTLCNSNDTTYTITLNDIDTSQPLSISTSERVTTTVSIYGIDNNGVRSLLAEFTSRVIAEDSSLQYLVNNSNIKTVEILYYHNTGTTYVYVDYYAILTSKYNAKFFNIDNIHDNYSDRQQGIVDSLTQRLSVIKGELWYNTSYGVPLFDKTKSKGIIDAYVISIILQHPNVVRIENFKSEVKNHNYFCNVDIISEYGIVHMTI